MTAPAQDVFWIDHVVVDNQRGHTPYTFWLRPNDVTARVSGWAEDLAKLKRGGAGTAWFEGKPSGSYTPAKPIPVAIYQESERLRWRIESVLDVSSV